MKLNPTLLHHFREPKNVGCLEETSSVGTGIAYQDENVVLQIQICIENDKIIKASFQAAGCYALIATGSWLTSTLENMTLAAAKTILPEQVIETLQLPAHKNYSAWLGTTALEKAIYHYEVKQRMHDSINRTSCNIY